MSNLIGKEVMIGKYKYIVVDVKLPRMTGENEVILELVDFGGPREVMNETQFSNIYCK